jgi:hypothetical protein
MREGYRPPQGLLTVRLRRELWRDKRLLHPEIPPKTGWPMSASENLLHSLKIGIRLSDGMRRDVYEKDVKLEEVGSVGDRVQRGYHLHPSSSQHRV